VSQAGYGPAYIRLTLQTKKKGYRQGPRGVGWKPPRDHTYKTYIRYVQTVLCHNDSLPIPSPRGVFAGLRPQISFYQTFNVKPPCANVKIPLQSLWRRFCSWRWTQGCQLVFLKPWFQILTLFDVLGFSKIRRFQTKSFFWLKKLDPEKELSHCQSCIFNVTNLFLPGSITTHGANVLFSM